ncbi:3D domain-containing protein [Gorillibacterium sp. sgz5001074]|uniref:3D domain-containing protein n=1 Tax=Gorillibacterium sp. sgz5001074 TaxID=3446695 RepID=UPI003F680C2C
MLTIRTRAIAVMFAILCILLQPAASVFAYPAASDDGESSPRYSYPYYTPYTEPEQAEPAPEEPAEAAPEPEAPSALTYIINSGDTLYKIARDFNIPLTALQAYNDIANPGSLQIGQKLMIPSVPADVPKLAGKEPVIKKVLSSTLTAYTSGKESTGKTPSHPAYGITYSGVKAEEGRTVAVDPSIIPLGSTVYIEGIGIRRAEDTGSAIKGAKIDVYMNDLEQAQTFGVKRNVKVFVLTEA